MPGRLPGSNRRIVHSPWFARLFSGKAGGNQNEDEAGSGSGSDADLEGLRPQRRLRIQVVFRPVDGVVPFGTGERGLCGLPSKASTRHRVLAICRREGRLKASMAPEARASKAPPFAGALEAAANFWHPRMADARVWQAARPSAAELLAL